MTCDEFENRFLASAENQSSAAERSAGEEHLVACSACRVLARQLQQLDGALTAKVKAPVLSVDFKQRLSQRIQAEAPILSEKARAERKRQLQAEYEAGLAQFRRVSVRVTDLLDGLPYLVLVALASWLGWQFLPGWINLLLAPGLSGFSQNLLLAALASVMFLAVGLAAAFPRSFRQLWSLV